MSIETRHVPRGEHVDPGKGMSVDHLGPQLAAFGRQVGDLQRSNSVVLEDAIGGGYETEATFARSNADLHGLTRVLEEKFVIARGKVSQGKKTVAVGGLVDVIRDIEGTSLLVKSALGFLLTLVPRPPHSQTNVLVRGSVHLGWLRHPTLLLTSDKPSVNLTIGVASRNPFYGPQPAESNLAGLVAFQADVL